VKCEEVKSSLTPGDWSPLQLSSYNLTKPSMKSKPSLRTETLQRPPPVRPALRSFTSGRSSAEPLETFRLPLTVRSDRDLVTPLPSSLSELDLRNIDPELAASLLQQIEAGAEVEPILVQLKASLGQVRTRDKMVTFQEDFSLQNI